MACLLRDHSRIPELSLTSITPSDCGAMHSTPVAAIACLCGRGGFFPHAAHCAPGIIEQRPCPPSLRTWTSPYAALQPHTEQRVTRAPLRYMRVHAACSDRRWPGFSVATQNTSRRVRNRATPSIHEATSLLLSLIKIICESTSCVFGVGFALSRDASSPSRLAPSTGSLHEYSTMIGASVCQCRPFTTRRYRLRGKEGR